MKKSNVSSSANTSGLDPMVIQAAKAARAIFNALPPPARAETPVHLPAPSGGEVTAYRN